MPHPNNKTLLLIPAWLGSSLFSFTVVMLDPYPLLAQSPPASNPSPKTEKFEYPQEVTRTFMKGCGFTNSREFCTCSLDGLRSQYSFADFLKIDEAARETKQVPQEVINIFQSCRNSKI